MVSQNGSPNTVSPKTDGGGGRFEKDGGKKALVPQAAAGKAAPKRMAGEAAPKRSGGFSTDGGGNEKKRNEIKK